ncbi:MAG: DUF1905 domain-containing protein [Streptosporangiales bacterium]|nr:DUF1905 domain-containing protein [Streptosporangiales bacterium]
MTPTARSRRRSSSPSSTPARSSAADQSTATPFQATLMPSGTGPHWLPLRAALCKAIGKHEAGAEVTVHLRQRLT